jgi:hypothetical protein
MDEWNRRAGYARILPFEAGKGAAYYCSKYVTKQFGDWNLSDNLAGFRQYQPILRRVADDPRDGLHDASVSRQK